MQKHKATFAMVLSAIIAGGCSWFAENNPSTLSFPGAYKIDIQQGNVITQEMVNQLRPGMTREQVRYVMGQALLPDAFNRDRWDYVYSFQQGSEPRVQQTLSVFFENDLLVNLEGNFRPDGKDNLVIDQVSAAANKAAQSEKQRLEQAIQAETP